MQVTVDIPETVFRKFEVRAAQQHRALADIVLSEILRVETEEEFRLRMEARYPLLKSAHPSSMKIPEGGLNNIFDDESA